MPRTQLKARSCTSLNRIAMTALTRFQQWDQQVNHTLKSLKKEPLSFPLLQELIRLLKARVQHERPHLMATYGGKCLTVHATRLSKSNRLELQYDVFVAALQCGQLDLAKVSTCNEWDRRTGY